MHMNTPIHKMCFNNNVCNSDMCAYHYIINTNVHCLLETHFSIFLVVVTIVILRISFTKTLTI